MAIACSLYDQLEISASRQQEVRLVFKNGNAEPSVFQGVIKTLIVKAGKEYLVSEIGEEWLLEGLASIEVIKPT